MDHLDHRIAPSLHTAAPFVAILLCIAILPLLRGVQHWWHRHHNKLLVSVALSVVTLLYYGLRGRGIIVEGETSAPGLATASVVLRHALFEEYFPFMVLLFSLYTISGGIVLRGDLRATPRVNVSFLAAGSLLASVIGTTGASMLLIRPLLQTNSEREHVRHTVVFFIFLVSNISGCLLPTGDPPLFLGYLRGVPFLWTLRLWQEWLFCTAVLLVVYYMWDRRMYAREQPLDRMLDATELEPLSLAGGLNFVWLAGVLLAVALAVPGEPLLRTSLIVPPMVREAAQLLLVLLAWVTTPRGNREANTFSFEAIAEVAVLFVGIFITMQAPIEILHIRGPQLGLTSPVHFFWASGALSSFLDNAPTYVVFFETAKSLPTGPGDVLLSLMGSGSIREDLLIGLSLGSVFMGANTYIGNGPNFMVKSLAEQGGVRMPSFFGYMAYSMLILIPVFVLVSLVFLQ